MEPPMSKAVSAASPLRRRTHGRKKQRILDALPLFLGQVQMALPVMRKLHPILRDAGWQVTVTLAWTGLCWEVVGLAPRQYGGPKLRRLRGPGKHHGVYAAGGFVHW